MSPAALLPWKLFAAGHVLRPATIEIQTRRGAAIVSWMGFDRSEISRQAHLANAKYIVQSVNSYGVLCEALRPFADLPLSSETPGVARDEAMDAIIYKARETLRGIGEMP